MQARLPQPVCGPSRKHGENPRYIETASRRGYRFVAPVREADASRRARWDVFISYSSKNQETALRLREWLRKCELRAFLSSRDLSFEIGTSKWLEAVDSVLERSGVLVLLATEEASSSEWVQHELEKFSRYKRLILPLKFGEQPLPKVLTECQIVEWDGSTAEPKVMQKILRVILGV
jgi:TIR domain